MMFDSWTRQEKIDALRGILQFLGIMIMVACIVVTIKYSSIFFAQQCDIKLENGSIEHTGLYGNCDYLKQFFVKPTIGGNSGPTR